MIIQKSERCELPEPLIESIKRIQFIPEKEHLPLANSQERFLEILDYLKGCVEYREHISKLSAVFGITTRQIHFYAETGERSFGLFDRSQKGFVSLTEIGISVSELSYVKRLEYLQSKLMMYPSFRDVKRRIDTITTKEVVEMLAKNDVFRMKFSDSSLKRRSGTLLSWAKWFNDNQVPLEHNEVSDYIRDNMDLIHWITNQIECPNMTYEDKFSTATLGLQKAFMKYDESRDNKFSTFAVACMRNEILADRKKQRAKKRGSTRQKLDIHFKNSYVSSDYGTGMSEPSMFSVEEVLANEERTTEEEYIHRERIKHLMECVNMLPEKQRFVIESYFFNNLSQLEIGKQIHMSQPNVNKILHRICRELRKVVY